MFKNNMFTYSFRKMWPFVKPYWFRALLGMLLTVPVGAMDAAIAAASKTFTDRFIINFDIAFARQAALFVIGYGIAHGILSYASTYINSWVGSKLALGIKRVLYDKLLDMDTTYFDSNNSGMVLQRFSTDADTAAGSLIENLRVFLTRSFSSVALFAVMIYNSWQLTIVAAFVMVFIIVPVNLVRKKVKNITNRMVLQNSQFLTSYNETFNGNKIINSFVLENSFKARFRNNIDRLFTLNIKMVQASGWLSPFMHFIGCVSIASVLLISGYFINSGSISTSNFVSFGAAMFMLYQPLKSLGNKLVNIQKAFLAIERIYEILDTVPSVKSNQGELVLDNIKDSVRFVDVHFSYERGKEVLHGITFKIDIGQTVALVGNSGGGKTTISSLIPRLYDVTDGEILIDGHNIQDYTIESLRSNIAVVFQDNFLFSGTIRENIILGQPNATEEDIWAAVKNANLMEFVEGLENKLDTEIGERGVLLSGGQKQRVAIARAFLKDAPLVILDEATSALDNKSEKVVQEALDNLMKNRTVIVIAHRLSTVRNADNILVINDGDIVEQGRHDELLLHDGAYAALYNMQFAKRDEG